MQQYATPQVPLSIFEVLHGSEKRSDVIVLQPGSAFLKIGLASDKVPHIVPHCLAKRMCAAPSQTDPHGKRAAMERLRSPSPKRMKVDSGDGSEPSVPSALIDEQEADDLRQREFHFRNLRRQILNRRGKLSRRQDANIKSSLSADTEFKELELSDLNAKSSEVRDDSSMWTDVSASPAFVFGQEALFIHPSQPYEVCYPLSRGFFNSPRRFDSTPTPSLPSPPCPRSCRTPGAPPRPPHTVADELECIWKNALTSYMKLDPRELFNFCVFLVVPDFFDKDEVRVMCDILMRRLRFRSVFVHIESVCATFGAGLSSACVVDIGDQSTAVTFVEDGAVLPHAKVHVPYGGYDVTRCLLWVLKKKAEFPHHEADLTVPLDNEAMRDIREKYCELITDFSRHEQFEGVVFKYTHPVSGRTMQASILAGDQLIMPALSYLNPGLLLPLHRSLLTVEANEFEDSVLEENYIELPPQAGPRPQKPTEPSASAPSVTPPPPASGGQQQQHIVVGSAPHAVTAPSQSFQHIAHHDTSTAPSPSPTFSAAAPPNPMASPLRLASPFEGTSATSPSVTPPPPAADAQAHQPEPSAASSRAPTPPLTAKPIPLPLRSSMGPETPVDEAIIHVIESSGTDIFKKKSFPPILLVGGGSHLRGLAEVLQKNVAKHWTKVLPADSVQVLHNFKDIDAQCTAWKGAGLMSALDSSKEGWTSRLEYCELGGIKAVKEKTGFLWS